MEITYKITGLKKLMDVTHQAPAVLASEISLALHEAVDLVKAEAEARTPEGPGHFGEHMVAAYRTDVTIDTAHSVGTVSNPTPEARWREFGTKAHSIPLAGSGRPLAVHLPSGVVIRKSVEHPGEKARHTMKNALRAAKPAIRILFLEALTGVTRSMAIKGD